MKIILSVCSFLMFLSLTHFQASAAQVSNDTSLQRIQKQGELKVCTDAGFLPFEMKTNQGKWIGFDVDMMQAFSSDLHVKLKMVQINFDGIIPALLTRKCDLIAAGMTATPQRAERVLFSNSTFSNGLSLAFLNKQENISQFKNLSSLDKKNIKIAVKTGYTSDLYLSKTIKNAQILRFDTDADLVLATLQGRANAFVSDTTYVALIKAEQPNKFFILPTNVTAEKFSIAGRKKDKKLMQSFNVFLNNWRKIGGYAKAEKYYFKDQKWRVATSK